LKELRNSRMSTGANPREFSESLKSQ